MTASKSLQTYTRKSFSLARWRPTIIKISVFVMQHNTGRTLPALDILSLIWLQYNDFIIITSVLLTSQALIVQETSKKKWAASSEFVSSSIPSWQILTAHAQPFRGARDLAFCLKVPLDSLLVWASSDGSGETARMRRLAWTFAARICDKYQIRLPRSK